MQQQVLLLIAALSLPALPAESRTTHAEPAVLVKAVPQGHLLSVHARGEPFERLLRSIGKQCGTHIALRRTDNRLHPVTVYFNDLPLEPAIKKLIRAAGITNYLIRYSGQKNSSHSITEVIIFGSGKIAEGAWNNLETMHAEKRSEPGDDFKPTDSSGEEYSQKIASFKDRYIWEDEETSTWAIYLLEAMPDEVKDFGLETIMQQLDKNGGNEKTVPLNAALFYRAIEDAAPPDIVPVMMHQIRRLSQHYHTSRAQEKDGTAGNAFQHNSTSQEGR